MEALKKHFLLGCTALTSLLVSCTQDDNSTDPKPLSSKTNIEIAGPFSDFAVGRTTGPSGFSRIEVYALGKSFIQGGHPIFKLVNGQWTDISNGQGALHIATQQRFIGPDPGQTDGDCLPVIVDSDNELLTQVDGTWTATFFSPLPVVPIDLAAGSGQIFILGSGSVSGGHPVYAYNPNKEPGGGGSGPFGSKPTAAGWDLLSGSGATQIDIGSSNVAWIVNNRNEIYYCNNFSSFTRVPGLGIEIGAGIGGEVAMIDPNKSTFKAINNTWVNQNLASSVTKIDIDANGTLWYLRNGYVQHL